jgi:hypothetical protein
MQKSEGGSSENRRTGETNRILGKSRMDEIIIEKLLPTALIIARLTESIDD